MKTLILGIGNPILTDDGVGIEVAHEIGEANPNLEVVETSEAGIALLDYIAGYDRLIIIDSIKTDEGRPGDLYKIEVEDFKPAKDLSSAHGIDIGTALTVGQGLSYRMPQSVSIYAIEVEDNTTFGEGCTEWVRKRIRPIAREIMGEEKL